MNAKAQLREGQNHLGAQIDMYHVDTLAR